MRVGILIDYFSPYHQSIVMGIQDVLNPLGHSAITIVGRELSGSYTTASSIFRLANRENLDGIIVLTASIGTGKSVAEVQRFCHNFGMPVVSIGLPVGGVPSVLVENTEGMRQLMEHLILVRNFKRFVFVKGSVHNPDAEAREAVFREYLGKHQIPVDEELIISGEFNGSIAMTAMSALLAKRRDFDVIVAASDSMAIGILDALEMEGLRVPEQYCVVGFDDSSEAQLSPVPLTTVRAETLTQGATAANLLLDKLTGRPTSNTVKIHTQLVVRESCGGSNGALASRGGMGLERFAKAAQLSLPILDRDWLAKLYRLGKNHVLKDTDNAGEILALWSEKLETTSFGQQEDWGRLSLQVLALMESWSTQKSDFSKATNVFAQLQQALNLRQRRFLATANSISQRIYRQVAHFNLELMSHEDESDLAETLIRNLPSTGFGGFFLCHFDELDSRLLFQIRDGEPDSRTTHFPSNQILPKEILGSLSGNWILFPLFDIEEAHGFIMLEVEWGMETYYESLRHNISSSLRNIQQLRDIEQHASVLENKILDRTRELESANWSLRHEIEERSRIETELVEANERLKHLALHDPLSGLSNRTAFEQYLAREWAVHTREDRPMGVLMCDIDFFKNYNDQYGHLEGDIILKTVSQALKSILREDIDLVSRFGGEEFAVILPFTDEPGTKSVAEKLRRSVEGLCIEHKDSVASRFLSISVGGCSAKPGDTTISEILKSADDALYHAKNSGRNRCAYRHLSGKIQIGKKVSQSSLLD